MDYVNQGSVTLMTGLGVGLYLCRYFEICECTRFTVCPHGCFCVSLKLFNSKAVETELRNTDSEIQPTVINGIIYFPAMS